VQEAGGRSEGDRDMARRFYARRLDFKSGKYAGFRWQIERDDYSEQGTREVKVKISRLNKLNRPVYSDYMTIKVRFLLINLLFPVKKSGRARYDVYEVKVWKGGKKHGNVTYHTKRHNALNRYFRIISSLMKHLETHDHAKGWRPPKK